MVGVVEHEELKLVRWCSRVGIGYLASFHFKATENKKKLGRVEKKPYCAVRRRRPCAIF